MIGDVRDISRFGGRDRFAAYNGTAPIEVSSGNRTVCRLSLRGNRRLNHAVHMAAVTQTSHRGSEGRAYYDKKVAEGKTPQKALRALKRKVSDAFYKRLRADAARIAGGPGGHPGNGSVASAAGSHPEDRLFGQATPGPAPTIRSRTPARKTTTPRPAKRPATPLDAKRSSICSAATRGTLPGGCVQIAPIWRSPATPETTAHADGRDPAAGLDQPR